MSQKMSQILLTIAYVCLWLFVVEIHGVNFKNQVLKINL